MEISRYDLERGLILARFDKEDLANVMFNWNVWNKIVRSVPTER